FRRGQDSTLPYISKLAVATIPAAVVGFTMRDWFEARFDDPVFAATMILVTGCLVWSSRWALGSRDAGVKDLAPLAVAAAASVYAGTFNPFLAVLGVQAALMTIARLTAPAEVTVGEPSWGAA